MYEIELKAHVQDSKDVESKLKSFAQFVGESQKKDTYWKKTIFSQSTSKEVQIRLRQEKHSRGDNPTSVVATYKRKNINAAQDGTKFEVNEEFEFAIDSRHSFEEFLKDAGFSVFRTKEKNASQWKAEEVFIELCNVPPLGDFLEMEILSEDKDAATVAAANDKFLRLLELCDIPKEAVEPRYYNEMLAQQD